MLEVQKKDPDLHFYLIPVETVKAFPERPAVTPKVRTQDRRARTAAASTFALAFARCSCRVPRARASNPPAHGARAWEDEEVAATATRSRRPRRGLFCADARQIHFETNNGVNLGKHGKPPGPSSGMRRSGPSGSRSARPRPPPSVDAAAATVRVTSPSGHQRPLPPTRSLRALPCAPRTSCCYCRCCCSRPACLLAIACPAASHCPRVRGPSGRCQASRRSRCRRGDASLSRHPAWPSHRMLP